MELIELILSLVGAWYVSRMVQPLNEDHILAGRPVLIIGLIFGGILGLAGFLFGFILAGLRVTGEASIRIFGQEIQSSNIGLAFAFLATVLGVLISKKCFTTLVALGQIP